MSQTHVSGLILDFEVVEKGYPDKIKVAYIANYDGLVDVQGHLPDLPPSLQSATGQDVSLKYL